MRLISFGPEHFACLAAWFGSEREAVQWGGTALSWPLESWQLEAMVAEGRGSPPARLCWMAEDRSELVGHAQLAFDWRNGNARLGRVAIAPAHRGKGLAVPMLRLVMAEAFARPSLFRLELNVYAENEAAIRTYEALGFVHEGCRRSSARVADARWDTRIMSILRPELAAMRSPDARTEASFRPE